MNRPSNRAFIAFLHAGVTFLLATAAGCGAYEPPTPEGSALADGATPDPLSMSAGPGAPADGGAPFVYSSERLSNFAKHSLLINLLPTVNDPSRTADPCAAVAADANKKWTFGYLMTQAANQSLTGVSANAFVKEWLRTFSTTQPVNGEDVPAVGLGPQIEEEWRLKSNQTGGALLMQHAPFRLLAITVRFDLRKNRRFGEGLGGELRFVFGHLRLQRPPEPESGKCSAGDGSTVILEYAVDKADENQVLAWARSWNALTQYDPTSAAYRQGVEQLTESIVRAGASPSRPNRSALLRIRTNGNPNLQPTWDLREWVIDATSKKPKPVTVKQSPRMALLTNATDPQLPVDATTIGSWINQNQNAILADTFVVPDKFPGTSTSFLGGFHTNNVTLNRVINASNIVSNDARHLFAKATCLGCHSVETGSQSQRFHISPRRYLEEAELSEFLAGTTGGQYLEHTDPVDGSIHYFNEVADREADVTALLNEWAVLPVVKAVPTAGQPSIAGQNYKLRVQNGGKCVDVADVSTASGGRLQQYTCNGNGNQRIMVEDQGNGFFRLRFKHSGMCADVPVTGTQVVQRPCSTSDNQKIGLERVRANGHVLHFRHSTKCLAITGSSTSNGANVVQEACTYAGNQVFSFVE